MPASMIMQEKNDASMGHNQEHDQAFKIFSLLLCSLFIYDTHALQVDESWIGWAPEIESMACSGWLWQ